ncbi:hypothetical protein E3N88_08921 [Mikania micrantha]|uniref:Uncharacterized protein n=1 Tax=Mikania micrantha TaxID=192012 RepID=A0A5N6PKQ7_9ASTR|nr:hypothetical protein E3N88_08921 [Mikania micrantha]
MLEFTLHRLQTPIAETLNRFFSQTFSHPCFNYMVVGGNDGSPDWVYAGGDEQDHQELFLSNRDVVLPNCSKNVITEDIQQKIIKQVIFLAFENEFH